MRLAELVPALRRTAPVFVATELARGFAQHGHDVTLLHLDDVVEFDPGVPARRVNWTDRLEDYDVVHSHMLRPDLQSAWHAHRSGPRRVATLHNHVGEDLANSHGRTVAALVAPLWAGAWRRMDARVVLSADAMGYYRRRLPGLSFECIPNGRSPHVPATRQVDEHERLQALAGRYRVIGANALVSPRKGLDQVIRALAGLPDYAFVLAGDGPELPALRHLAQELGVADRFVPLGFKADARDYLDLYDLYVMPSRSEGLPLALLEAAAAGRAIVCSRLPVFEEVFDDTQAAFFTGEDIEGLQQALRRAWAGRASLGAAARERYEARYSTARMVAAYLALFDRLVGASLIGPTA